MNPRKQIVLLGAGPVGLLTAIQAKLFMPEVQIIIAEKHKEYQRKHLLMLERSSFRYTTRDEAFQDFVNRLSGSIRTNDLEDQLLECARGLGIEFDYIDIKSCSNIPVGLDDERYEEAIISDLTTRYPDADIYVGTDGSHSTVHRDIFDGEYQLKKSLQYTVEIKYEVTGGTRYLRTITELPAIYSHAKHFVSEFVGQEREGKTPISLRIFVNKETYEKMKGANFKNPYTLDRIASIDDPDICALDKTIRVWLAARERMAPEKFIEGTERITATHLPLYASDEFIKILAGKLWAICGDSAFGTPYFRSLNNGIIASSVLALVLYAHLNKIKMREAIKLVPTLPDLKTDDPQEYYQIFMRRLIKYESLIAECKNVGVNTFQSSATLSRFYPVATVARQQLKLTKSPGAVSFNDHMNNCAAAAAAFPAPAGAYSDLSVSSSRASSVRTLSTLSSLSGYSSASLFSPLESSRIADAAALDDVDAAEETQANRDKKTAGCVIS